MRIFGQLQSTVTEDLRQAHTVLMGTAKANNPMRELFKYIQHDQVGRRAQTCMCVWVWVCARSSSPPLSLSSLVREAVCSH